jgi:hypothetical protein
VFFFFLFILDIFIILHLTYLSPFFFLSLFFCHILFLIFPFFFLNFFFEKKYYVFIFYALNIYHSVYTWSIYIILLFLFLFFFNFFWKIIIRRLRKWCFTVTILILLYSSITLKISLRSYMFLLPLYILLYASINFFIHGYIFHLMSKKHVNNTYTLILLC